MPDYEQPYWSEWSDRIITRYNMKKVSGGNSSAEYHGPCPSCGGTDRFRINEYQNLVKVHCRQCGTDGFRDIINEMKHDGVWPVFKQENAFEHKPTASDFENIIKLKPGSNMSTYIEAKQIELINAELDGDTVVIPLYNFEQEVVGHQRIAPNGLKKFNKGLVKDQAFGVIGTLTGDCTAWVTEGYATGVSVHMALDQQVPVIFALDAGTLPKICNAFAIQWPDITLQIAADNDTPGIAAAKASQRQYALPEIQGADWNDIHVSQGLDSVKQGLQRLHDAWVEKPKPKLFTHIDDLVIQKPDWLIDGLIERDTLAMCFGASGSGKTFLVLDMALSIATGKQWNEHNVKQSSVFYLCGEGGNGLTRRVAAWKKHHQIKDGQAQFYKSNRAVILSNEQAVAELEQAIDELIDQAGTPGLIIVDTLARALGGADERSGVDVNLLIMALDRCRAKYKDCTVLLVHHTGHSNKERGRGASELTASLDHEFRVEQVGDDELAKVVMTWTKQKDDAFPEPMAFSKLPITLMTPDMFEVSSIVLEATADVPNMSGNGSGMSKSQRAVMSLFEELQEHDEVERDRLRDEYLDRYATDNRRNDRSRFNRVLTGLIELQKVTQKDGVVRRCDEG